MRFYVEIKEGAKLYRISALQIYLQSHPEWQDVVENVGLCEERPKQAQRPKVIDNAEICDPRGRSLYVEE